MPSVWKRQKLLDVNVDPNTGKMEMTLGNDDDFKFASNPLDGSVEIASNDGNSISKGPNGVYVKNSDSTGYKMDGNGNLMWANLKDADGNTIYFFFSI